MINNEFVILKSGKKLNLNDVVNLVPGSVFESEIHYKISKFFLEFSSITDPDLKNILLNAYFLKSKKIKKITSLVLFIQKNHGNIKVVRANCRLRELFIHLGQNANFNLVGNHSSNYIDKSILFNVFFKLILSWLFRLFSKPLTKKNIIRAWVEVTLDIYEKETSSSQLRIFPFAMGFIRQIKFVRSCKSRSIDYSLDGIPYSFFDYIKMVIYFKKFDCMFAFFERNAYLKYADQLITNSCKKIFTTDEFEISSFILNSRLIDSGALVLNTAHGIGNYCPYVSYTKFYVYNEGQESFYSVENKLIFFEKKEVKNLTIFKEVSKNRRLSNLNPVVIFLYQNFNDYSLLYDYKEMLFIIDELNKYSKNNSLNFFIKLHPNTKKRDITSLGNIYGADSLIFDWSILGKSSPIFFTINSSAAFEVNEFFKTFIYSGEYYFPDEFFGEGFLHFNSDNLEVILNGLFACRK